jgi:rhodanese-related sulfurtransferase
VEFLQHNIWLVLLAVLSGFMLLLPNLGARLRGIKEVGVSDAVQLINHRDALVIDVREDSEYNAGHIPHSKHFALGHLAGRVTELEKFKGHPVVVLCRSGMRSASACSVLKKHGFNEVYNLKGGIMAWEQASMPVEKK